MAVFLLYAATIATESVINDALSSTLASWRIGVAGTPWFDGFDLDAVPRTDGQELWTGVAANGHVAVFRSPGVIAAPVPAYWLAGGTTAVSGWSLVPGGLTAAALTALALGLLLSLLRRHLPTSWALTSTLALGLTTPYWSVAANTMYTHTVTLPALAGMAWAADRQRWWLVGLCGGAALWGRLHVALVVALLGLGLAVWRRRPAIAVVVGAVSAACMGAASLWSHWVYGTWSPTGGYPDAGAYAERVASGGAGGPVDLLVNQAGLWLSPDRGLLVWTPVLLLLVPALARAWRTLPDWSRLLACGGLLYAGVQGLMNVFHGGSSFFGYRLTLEVLACAFPALALATPHLGSTARRLLGPVLGLQFAAISVGAYSEGFFLPWTAAWTDNAALLALRTVPALGVWFGLCLLLGWLGGQVWAQRWSADRLSAAPRPAPSRPPRVRLPG